MKQYKAYELGAFLNCLQLAGQDSDGDLEWVGTSKQWGKVDMEEEKILSNYYNKTNCNEHE